MSGVQLTNVIKANYLTITFQGFSLPFSHSYFKEQLLCAYRAGPYHSMRHFQSKPICSLSTFVVLERGLYESSCSGAFEKTGEVVNNAMN